MNLAQLTRLFQSLVYPVSKVMNRIASIILFFMMALTITDVFLRKVFSRSILGTVELTEFLMLILVFFTLAQTEILNGHVKVDLVMSRFSERIQSFVDMVTQFVCFLLFGLFTWSALVYSAKMRTVGEASQDLWLPLYPFIFIVALGCAILGLILFIKFLTALLKMARS